MATYPVVWVDAFTTTALAGNACAVVLDARGLDDARMLLIARETNLSETAFVFPGDGAADRVVRYWTPIGEIPLAGHPTIATTHALVERGLVDPAPGVVRLRMPAALVPVRLARDPGGAPRYAMEQPAPTFHDRYDRGWAAAALGLGERDLLGDLRPRTVSTGTKQLMIPLASREALDRVRADRVALFAAPRDYFSVHVFARGDARDDGAALAARHFADLGDVAEDPFTGSATGGMAALCAREGIVTARAYEVAQGAHVGRPGRARVAVAGEPPDRIGTITVSGNAVTVMTATLTL